ncbi:HupE/UreJ family protein [Ferrovibrio terrae]|uniref:HupE/UreJ family protein n=1 Tax=Ferrovibrio terrae TaxID=2594003 RepID=UPI003137771E
MVRSVTLAAVTLALAYAAPALAHHPMGGVTPSTLSEGLLSGFGHPILGFDHFVFILAAGLLAAPRARGLLLPLAFVVGSFAGSLLHLGSITIPGGEYLIAGSVILLGFLLLSPRAINDGLFAAILAVAGLLHGHALAEAIFGAEATPLVAYLAGLAVTQYLIAAAVVLAWRKITVINSLPQFNRIAGAGVAAVGAVFLALNIAG